MLTIVNNCEILGKDEFLNIRLIQNIYLFVKRFEENKKKVKMFMTDVNDVKIYNLSAGKSLPEVCRTEFCFNISC